MTLSITEYFIKAQHLDTQNNDTRQNDTQHKDIRHCGPQHKNTQYNPDDQQHKRCPAQCYAVSQFLLCCVIILCVIMLIVVAPIFDIFCVEIVDENVLLRIS